MNVTIAIREQSCRGCELCADVCPTDVLTLDADTHKMLVAFPQDCIECLSCSYVCPSAALTHEGVRLVRDFARNTLTTKNLSRYL